MYGSTYIFGVEIGKGVRSGSKNWYFFHVPLVTLTLNKNMKYKYVHLSCDVVTLCFNFQANLLKTVGARAGNTLSLSYF